MGSRRDLCGFGSRGRSDHHRSRCGGPGLPSSSALQLAAIAVGQASPCPQPMLIGCTSEAVAGMRESTVRGIDAQRERLSHRDKSAVGETGRLLLLMRKYYDVGAPTRWLMSTYVHVQPGRPWRGRATRRVRTLIITYTGGCSDHGQP